MIVRVASLLKVGNPYCKVKESAVVSQFDFSRRYPLIRAQISQK